MLARAALRLTSRSALFAPVAAAALLARPNPILRGTAAPSAAQWTRGLAQKRGSKNVDSTSSPTQPPTGNSSPNTPPPPKSDSDSAISPDSPEQFQQQIPLDQLPDLTQGIPSTLEYETTGKQPSALATTEEADSGGKRGKGELPASAYVSSGEKRRNAWARYMSILVLGSGVMSIGYLGRNWDTEAEMRKYPEAPNGFSLVAWWDRFKIRSTVWLTYYQEPSFEKLLPDPDPSFARPYTLVLSLEDLLVHSEWDREHGWRVAKRPGVDYFLRYLSQYYELVLFTSVAYQWAEPIVRKLDPFHFIMWPLFKEATHYREGEPVKDLSYLNRDLSKVIILDTNSTHVSAQPENAIVLKKWEGDRNDKDLVGLIPFLEYIHTMSFEDTRKVLKSFKGKHIPTEFARREAIARNEFNKDFDKRKKGTHHERAPSGLGFLGGLFGLKPANMTMMQAPEGEENPQEAFAKGKMLQDVARERGQKNYLMLEEQIQKHGDKWLKEEAEMMEKAQKEAMNTMKSSMFTWFGPPPPASTPPESK